MFSKDITNSDHFIDMPLSSQALYFHLWMNADDDGFVSPKWICRLIQAKDDDLKMLAMKWFIIFFEDSVIVITHRKTNNEIKKDRHKKTIYAEHLKILGITDWKYTLDTKCIQNVSKMETQVRLGKVRLEEDRLDTTAKAVVEQSSLIHVEKKEYWDPEINECIKIIKKYNNWIIDWTQKEQRNSWKSLLIKLKQIDPVASWKFTWQESLSAILEIVSKNEYHRTKITSTYNINKHLGVLQQVCRWEFDDKKWEKRVVILK